MQSERRVHASLALIGAASAGLYALLALRYPLAVSLANPRGSWADLTAATWASFAYHTAIYLGLTVLYIWALRLLAPTHDAPHRPSAASDRARLLIIVLTWLVCCGILMTVASSGESHDIFDYIFRGRMMTVLGANPLTDVPTQYRGAPYFDYLAWYDHVDAYGPVWEMTSAATSAVTRAVLKGVGTWTTSNASCPQSPLACRSLIGYVSAYRLLAVGLTGLSGWLILSMVRRSRPHLAAAALAAWLWSPLLLIATAIGAHNDAAMIVLLLLMLWLLQRRRWFPALLVLVLAAHVKLTVVIVTPVVGLWLVRRCGWRRTMGLGAAAAAVGLLLSWVLYAPFGGWGSLPRMLTERAAYLANSPWRVLYLFLSMSAAGPSSWRGGSRYSLPRCWRRPASCWSRCGCSISARGAGRQRPRLTGATTGCCGAQWRWWRCSIWSSAASGFSIGTWCGCWPQRCSCLMRCSRVGCCPGWGLAR